MQRRIAQTAVSASAARKMGPAGTIGAARSYFADLDLARLAVASEMEFRKVLNSITGGCLAVMSPRAQHWGAARKWTNIFLRDVVYDRYLCCRYRLRRVVPWLELPLDSHVAEALRQEDGGDRLDEWGSVIGLIARESRRYQTFAAKVAAAKGIERVHLDLLYWRRPEKSQCLRFEDIGDVQCKPGVYEIHTLAGTPLKVGIADDLHARIQQHAESYQSRLVLKPGGHRRYPEDVSSKRSILAKHLYFDGALTAEYDLRKEVGRQTFLADQCQVFIRYTRNRETARKIEIKREQSGIFRYVGRVVRKYPPRRVKSTGR